eukprot:CAMPEP_0194048490 /NCGR_PEP_ID=MMETSP0009_2-20130614/27451_1 /TAXON_ID=210454 /ORGANISM="Grammatophora oceanica, Strain CCMP 410" /LENGTH=340 /DNA_ID=CAMNT_0038694363 /DNA_START=57 /DNA_END=1080 /DNA_ORIENTATION=+
MNKYTMACLSTLLLVSMMGSVSSFQIAPMSNRGAVGPLSLQATDSYLSVLDKPVVEEAMPSMLTVPNGVVPQHEDKSTFSHASFDYFSIDQLTPKGARKNADVGEPHDATRPLVTVGPASAGSWWCAAGGWPSPALRATTEIFYVFSGRGCVTDLDDTPHYFGPGDTVILPKGWSGRWDIQQDVHKVWVVNDHPNIEETTNPIRAVITPYQDLAPKHLLEPQGEGNTLSQTVYKVGPTEVGCLMREPGSYPVSTSKTQAFYILEGVFFLTNEDGTAQRCVAGDTLVIPKVGLGSGIFWKLPGALAWLSDRSTYEASAFRDENAAGRKNVKNQEGDVTLSN